MELSLFRGLSKLTTKRLRKQVGKKRRTTKGNGMESLEIHIDHNIASVLLFLLFPSLFFLFSFVLKGRGPCYFVSSLTMHAASIFGNNTRRERGRVRPREQKGPREETSQRER